MTRADTRALSGRTKAGVWFGAHDTLAADETRSSVRVPSSRPLSGCERTWRHEAAAPKGREIDFLATFGDLSGKSWLCRAKYMPQSRGYGTEVQRFESSRARYTIPCAVGFSGWWPTPVGGNSGGNRAISEQVAPRADGCARVSTRVVRGTWWFTASRVASASSMPARWPRLGRSSWSATARRGRCAAARRCTGSASRGLIATPAPGTTACAPTRAAV